MTATAESIDSTKFPALSGTRREKFILKLADAFLDTSRLALRRAASVKEEEFQLALVYGVNGAFAVELYLKCLLTVEGSHVPSTHNLKNLFQQLSRESRARITRRHNDLAKENAGLAAFRRKGINTELNSLLDDGQDVFKNFRYLFESIPNRMKPIGFALELFGEIVRNRILDLRPDWVVT